MLRGRTKPMPAARRPAARTRATAPCRKPGGGLKKLKIDRSSIPSVTRDARTQKDETGSQGRPGGTRALTMRDNGQRGPAGSETSLAGITRIGCEGSFSASPRHVWTALEAPLFRRRPLDHKSGKRRKLSPCGKFAVGLRRSGTMPAGRPRERPVAASPPALKCLLRRAGHHPDARRWSSTSSGMPYRGARPASPGPRAGYSSGST